MSEREMLAMRDVLTHRGPDDAGLYLKDSIGLGHRRLSIIDLSGGRQPITNEDGSVVIVFNGEIYNFQELRDDLISKGHRFSTRSDTEVIVHLYEDLGIDCLQKLRGMFAFALWDSARHRLLLARDRLGEKPLYYCKSRDSVIFASEIKGLAQSDSFDARIDPVGLRRYLAYRHPYGTNTLFSGVSQLPPASYLVADRTGTRIHRYWTLALPDRDHPPIRSDDEFLPMLNDSVRMRMISDVPIGAFLSGGIDSSMITALMAQHSDHVKTFSIGFDPSTESELPWARQVAEALGSDHHEFVQGSDDFFALLQKLVWHHDEPLAFPASIPLYLLSRESRSLATVVLAGEGADELLAGYGNNVRAYWVDRLTAPIPGFLRQAISAMPLPGRLAPLVRRAAMDPEHHIAATLRLPGYEALTRACRQQLPDNALDDDSLLAELDLSSRSGSFLDRLLYFQLKTYLVALLMKQDKMSMAASIETRVPFLDHELVELAFALPDRSKIRRQTGKSLLRAASRGLLPEQIINRPKRGFPVPIAEWFRRPGNPFIETLLDTESSRNGLLEHAYIEKRVAEFRKGAPISMELWAMLNLEIWRRHVLVPPVGRIESTR